MDQALLENGLQASYAHCQQIRAMFGVELLLFVLAASAAPARRRCGAVCLFAADRRSGRQRRTGRSAPHGAGRVAAVAAPRSLPASTTIPYCRRLSDTVRSCGVSPRHLEDVIDGVEMDLEPAHYETFEHLAQYCHRVASAVGLACLPIWGCSSSAAEDPARSCGLAFQLTNILRDLKEDALAGRRLSAARGFRVALTTAPEGLRSGIRNDRFRQLMQFQIDRAERLYEAGGELVSHLSTDGQRVFGSMLAVYRALLAEIKRRDGDVLRTACSSAAGKKCESLRNGSPVMFPRRTASEPRPHDDVPRRWPAHVAIVGGGLAGLATAVALAESCRVRTLRITPLAWRTSRIVPRPEHRRHCRPLPARQHGLLHEPGRLLQPRRRRGAVSPGAPFAFHRARRSAVQLARRARCRRQCTWFRHFGDSSFFPWPTGSALAERCGS